MKAAPTTDVPTGPKRRALSRSLPQHEFGLDVAALVGVLRHRDHRSVPEIHAALRERGVDIAERSVTNLLDRYDELLATSPVRDGRLKARLAGQGRLKARLAGQGRVILALDSLQPDVAHEVLWVVRDVLSGEVLLARSLLSGTADDLAPLLKEATDVAGVPVAGVVTDGQLSLRRAVEAALPGVPHQLCPFHFLGEAARPVIVVAHQKLHHAQGHDPKPNSIRTESNPRRVNVAETVSPARSRAAAPP